MSGAVAQRLLVRATDDRVVHCFEYQRRRGIVGALAWASSFSHIACVFRRHNMPLVPSILVWSFHGCTGKIFLPSHIWYQKKRNCIPYKMVESPLRSCLGNFFTERLIKHGSRT